MHGVHILAVTLSRRGADRWGLASLHSVSARKQREPKARKRVALLMKTWLEQANEPFALPRESADRTVAVMTRAKRERQERTDNWELIQQWCRMPEQRLYESIRPITLFGIPPAERAQETGFAEHTLRRTADTFDSLGMACLFRPTKQQREDHHRSLPVPMRQLIADLKAEYPNFSLREIAEICYVQFDRRPSHITVKQVLSVLATTYIAESSASLQYVLAACACVWAPCSPTR